MKPSIAKLFAAAALVIAQEANGAPEAVGVPRRTLTDAEVEELLANMDCVDSAQRGNQLSEAEALSIARRAISISDARSTENSTFNASRDECGWFVEMTWQSPGPGDHRSIRINGAGRVLAYVRGL